MAEEGTKIGNINEIAAAIGKSVAANLAAGSKDDKVLGIERDREAAKERAEFKQILQGIHKSLTGSFATFKDRDKKSGGLLAGLLGGVSGKGIGALGKGIAQLGTGLAVGLGALGAGIAAFFLALGTADWLLKWSGADGQALNALIKNFFGAFDAKAAVMMGGLVAAGVAISSMGKFAAPKLMAGMTAIAAGLVGFFTGILLGEKGLTWMSEGMAVTGAGLGKMFNTFFESFSLTSGAMIMGLVAIGAAVASMGKFAPLKLIAGMTALGAGLVGFFAGILIGEKGLAWIKDAAGVDGTGIAKLMNTFVSAFKDAGPEAVGALFAVLAAGALAGMGKVKPLSIVTGMTALGAGLVGFFGGLILAEKGAEWALGDLMKAPPGENLAKLMKGFLSSFKGVGAEGIAALGLILAAGAVIGMKKGMGGGLSVALGMTGMGMGLAGFFGGIALAEVGIKGLSAWSGSEVDGSKLAKLMKNFMGAFDGVSDKGLLVLGALLAAGAAMGALLSVKQLVMVPIGMTALGAGIAGFFSGLALADTLMEKAQDWTGKAIDGSTLSTFMGNFATALDGMSDKSLKILGGMLVAGAAIGVLLPGVGPLGVALGMTALGAGLAGFFAGLSMADFVASKAGTGENLKQLMTNLGEGIGGFIGGIAGGAMKGFLELDADKLSQIGAGVKDLGMGMLAFAGGTAGGAVAGVMEGISSFFGSKSPLAKIEDFVDDFSDKDAKRLTTIGKGMHDLGLGFQALGGVDATKVNANLTAMSDMKALGLADMEKTIKDTHVGSLIQRGGKYNLMAGEAVMTPSQLTNMAKTMELLVGSQNLEQSKNGGPPVIINNVDNSQKTAVSSNRSQAINVPTTPHNSQSTKRMLDEAYAFG